MIGKDAIAEAARNNDAITEERLDLPGFYRERGVDIDGLYYVAEQRALRVIMMIQGVDPNVTQPILALNEAMQALMPLLIAIYTDGFATGLTVKDKVQG